MSLRRVERIVLGNGLKFNSIQSISFVTNNKNSVTRDFKDRFLPDIRFTNPTFSFTERVPTTGEKEMMVIDFGIHGTHSINMDLYTSSNVLAQRIRDLDAELFNQFK